MFDVTAYYVHGRCARRAEPAQAHAAREKRRNIRNTTTLYHQACSIAYSNANLDKQQFTVQYKRREISNDELKSFLFYENMCRDSLFVR